MAARGRRDFMVKVIKKEVVAIAAGPVAMPSHFLPLSNLDLLLPPLDVGVFFCYKKKLDLTFGSMVNVLKQSMAQALVHYYVFAGEVVKNSMGEPQILCNNRGVDFIEAFVNIEIRDLDFYNPDESIEGNLVPTKNKGVLAIQATELKCGGIVVGCTFDHRIADAYSTNMFLVAWLELARSEPLSMRPLLCRSLLHPSCSSIMDPTFDKLYVPISSVNAPPNQPPPDGDNHLISRIYYVTADQLSSLQSLASNYSINIEEKRTKIESFSAFLWKIIAQYEKNGSNQMVKLGIVVDGRRLLCSGEEENSMSSYFGNVLSIPFAGKKVDELAKKSLNWVANEVNKFLKFAVTKEHFLGLIDWVEGHRPELAMAKVYHSKGDEGPAIVMSSGLRFPVGKVDFAWGKALFGSYHFPWGGEAGYVMPMPSPAATGDWVVYMHLMKKHIEYIEMHGGHILRPLSFDYLDFKKF